MTEYKKKQDAVKREEEENRREGMKRGKRLKKKAL
jgi:hypothetical protein